MSYTKTTWVEDGSTPINATRLNNLETQYDESIADAEALRKDSTKELLVESKTVSGETATEGRLIFDNGVLYGADGSAFSILSHKRKWLMAIGNDEVIFAQAGDTITFRELVLGLYMQNNTESKEAYYVTADAIDLTPYSKLYIAWEGSVGGTNSYAVLAVSTTKIASYSTYDARIARTTSFEESLSGVGDNAQREFIDVSSLSGNHYIRIHSVTGTGTVFSNLIIRGLWLGV